MKLSEFVKSYRAEHNLSQRQFAINCDLSNGYIWMIENNRNPKTGEPIVPSMTALQKLANGMQMSLNELFSLVDDMPVDLSIEAPLPSNIKPISEIKPQRIRLIGEVAAGEPILAEEDYDAYIDVDTPIKADYALRVHGDSMEPLYLDGDVIYIRERPDVDDGQIAVVLVDDSATLKHVYHDKDGLTLVSENLKYAPMHKTFQEYDCIRILGIVVGYTRMYASANPLNGVTRGFPKK